MLTRSNGPDKAASPSCPSTISIPYLSRAIAMADRETSVPHAPTVVSGIREKGPDARTDVQHTRTLGVAFDQRPSLLPHDLTSLVFVEPRVVLLWRRVCLGDLGL